MADSQTILYQKQRRGVLITLNRPHALNAMNEELLEDLDSALAKAETDPEIRAMVITGAGGTFSAGEDIRSDDPETAWPYGIPQGASLVHEYNRLRDSDRKDILRRQLYRWQYPKPIIGAVSGWCLGAASWLALTCHITIAADDAIFGQPQVRHGANTDFIWVALAGFKNALRYSLTGDHVDAQEALRIGLVNQVVPEDELLETCFKFVERIAHVPPETVKINLQDRKSTRLNSSHQINTLSLHDALPISNTDFIWVALAGFKNALRYSLTGDHVDAQEALRIGLVNQVVPEDELLETCFKFVERIAHVPPETVKINL